MNCNRNKGKIAPHKAIMLLTVMECASNGTINNGFVPHNDMMVQMFEHKWKRYVGESHYFNPVFATPFFHLSYEPFWRLIKTDNFIRREEYSLGSLRKSFYGARIEDDLWEYMIDSTSRQRLIRALLEKFNFVDNSNDSHLMATEKIDEEDGILEGHKYIMLYHMTAC